MHSGMPSHTAGTRRNSSLSSLVPRRKRWGMVMLLVQTALALIPTPPAVSQLRPQASGASLSFGAAVNVVASNGAARIHDRRPVHIFHGSRPLTATSSTRCRAARMMSADEDEAPDASGRFGFQWLLKTCTFVTLWWALWSLYDLYLTPYSPAPELVILAAFAGYSWSEERRPSTIRSVSADAKATWGPCNEEGCEMEDILK